MKFIEMKHCRYIIQRYFHEIMAFFIVGTRVECSTLDDMAEKNYSEWKMIRFNFPNALILKM